MAPNENRDRSMNSGNATKEADSTTSFARRKATADAIAGVIASLVSLWAFYPVDVYKTHLQATSACHSNENQNNSNNRNSPLPNSSSSTIYNPSDLWFTFRTYLLQLFRGLPVKSWHTIASNFCYFYLESWMTSRWIKLRDQQQRRRRINIQDNPQQQKTLHLLPKQQQQQQQQKLLSPWEHLIVSALAAMLNTLLTLPLDVLSLQSQVVPDEENDSTNDNHKKKNSENNDCLSHEKQSPVSHQYQRAMAPTNNNNNDMPPTTQKQTMDDIWISLDEQQQEDDTFIPENQPTNRKNEDEEEEDVVEEKKDDRIIPVKPPTHATATCNFDDETKPGNRLTRLVKFFSWWKGLVPSLLLCSNPSIHYTVYDLIKNYLLLRSSSSVMSSESFSAAVAQSHKTHLTWSESFGAGIVAKLTATLLTYPLIRAKVLLILRRQAALLSTTTTSNNKQSTTKGQTNGCHNGDSDNTSHDSATTIPTSNIRGSSSSSSSSSMIQCLMEQYQQYGLLAGWYRGCSIQILHTVLKSALVMMVREHIMEGVHKCLSVVDQNQSP